MTEDQLCPACWMPLLAHDEVKAAACYAEWQRRIAKLQAERETVRIPKEWEGRL